MPAARLLSLDAFRGVTIAAMVVVNNAGSWSAVYRPLKHAAWHGITPTDLVFPFFLFIVGMAVPASLAGRRLPAALARVLRRTVVIFLLGLVLNALASPWAAIRIPGVLQRIAVCYLVAALIYLVSGWRTQAGIAAALLLGYWTILMRFAAPGYPAGDLTPAGNIAGWVDRVVLGAHVWRVSRVYDPEGILSTLPAIATVLLGVLAGRWLGSERGSYAIAHRLMLAGSGAVVVGIAWSIWLPMNKSLWTSSYALFTAGLATVVFAACYWLVEIRGHAAVARPFAVLGVNALALFFLSTATAHVLTLLRVGDGSLQRWLFQHAFASWASPYNASLAYALAYLLVWWGAMWLLDRAGLRLRA